MNEWIDEEQNPDTLELTIRDKDLSQIDLARLMDRFRSASIAPPDLDICAAIAGGLYVKLGTYSALEINPILADTLIQTVWALDDRVHDSTVENLALVWSNVFCEMLLSPETASRTSDLLVKLLEEQKIVVVVDKIVGKFSKVANGRVDLSAGPIEALTTLIVANAKVSVVDRPRLLENLKKCAARD